MGAQGTATLDFGAFPGASDASVAVTGQTGIVTGSAVEAWIRPEATSDHSADEHMVENFKVFADASSIVAGTGFTIRGFNTTPEYATGDTIDGYFRRSPRGGARIYGQWKVSWVWN